jgi:hypothetical protein
MRNLQVGFVDGDVVIQQDVNVDDTVVVDARGRRRGNG